MFPKSVVNKYLKIINSKEHLINNIWDIHTFSFGPNFRF